MRQFIFTILGLLMTSVSWAFGPSSLSFVSCEKTYINPEEILLEHATIHVQSENISGITSAIYSDGRGLYFKDIQLEEVLSCDDFFDEDLFGIYSDEPMMIISDASLEEVLLSEPQQKNQRSPRSTCWPYCEKSP